MARSGTRVTAWYGFVINRSQRMVIARPADVEPHHIKLERPSTTRTDMKKSYSTAPVDSGSVWGPELLLDIT